MVVDPHCIAPLLSVRDAKGNCVAKPYLWRAIKAYCAKIRNSGNHTRSPLLHTKWRIATLWFSHAFRASRTKNFFQKAINTLQMMRFISLNVALSQELYTLLLVRINDRQVIMRSRVVRVLETRVETSQKAESRSLLLRDENELLGSFVSG